MDFLNRLYSSSYLGRCMGEIFINRNGGVVFYFFQSSGSTIKTGDSFKELFRRDAEFLKRFFCRTEVLEVVTSEYFDGIPFLTIGQEKLSVVIGCMRVT